MPVSMSHTSVPRWATGERVPDVPSHAARIVIVVPSRDHIPCGADDSAAMTTDASPAAAILGAITDRVAGEVTVASPAQLPDLLETAVVGWHFVLLGDDATVTTARARLLAAGAIDAEITVVVTDSGARRVFCTHCRTVTTADIGIGDTVPCAGCDAPLAVYYHFSRRLGAYMGYRVDSEELP